MLQKSHNTKKVCTFLNEIKLFEVLMKFTSGELPFTRGHAST